MVLPAIAKAGGTDDERGAIAAMAAYASTLPAPTASAFKVILDADYENWFMLDEGDEIEVILRALLDSSDAEARELAKEAIHTLVARGHGRYKTLLPPAGE